MYRIVSEPSVRTIAKLSVMGPLVPSLKCWPLHSTISCRFGEEPIVLVKIPPFVTSSGSISMSSQKANSVGFAGKVVPGSAVLAVVVAAPLLTLNAPFVVALSELTETP